MTAVQRPCAIFLLTRVASAYLILPDILTELHPGFNASWTATSELEALAAKPAMEQPFINIVGPHDLCGGGGAQHYSGYLPAGSDASYFFWLVRSAKKPANRETTPLILWLSGGPGCSSSLGMLFENGPCRIVGRKGNGWETKQNPWSWTEAAHVVWVDQPAGVGFSVGREMVRDELGVATRMTSFLRNFFAYFEDLRHAPFFVTGESFAGHYVPAVAARVLQESRDAGFPAELKGIALGNALVSPVPQFLSKPEMARTGGIGGSLGKGVVSDEVYRQMLAAKPFCKDKLLACEANNDTPDCMNALWDCVPPFMLPITRLGRNPYDLRELCSAALRPLCYNFSMETSYLNDANIQKTLGVQPQVWSACSKEVALPFFLSGDWFASFAHDVALLLAANIRVLAYSGDCDFMVDWIGSKTWLMELAWPHRERWSTLPDRQYIIQNRTRGLERSFGGLTFLQVYDAGHLVPHDQPMVALSMIRDFVSPSSKWATFPTTLSSRRTGDSDSILDVSAWLVASMGLLLAGSLVALWRWRKGLASQMCQETGYVALG
eukprot:TRINITY_DN45623_c0_g1_i1.p1 TRINITY_DN45623_c0_g1~~TRINITY_DN45623_c0_g1_i1.p1  ORF type:complete len:550 (+),score=63.23 TRINITY_DN45623_c0_g1_i1:201-1850(+)